LHVGSDATNKYTVGISGPVFEDGTFEFIPIVECMPSDECETKEQRTYQTLLSPNDGGSLSRYVPSSHDNAIIHYDPDIENFTYSDPVNSRRGYQLLKLLRDDYLFFVASLAPPSEETYRIRSLAAIRVNQRGRMAKYVIGYQKILGIFVIDKTGEEYTITTGEGREVDDSTTSLIRPRLFDSAHFKRLVDTFICSIGIKDREKILLRKASKLTESGSPFRPNELGHSLYGDRGFPRGYKWIGETEVKLLLSRID
jgi:hypothetical protein